MKHTVDPPLPRTHGMAQALLAALPLVAAVLLVLGVVGTRNWITGVMDAPTERVVSWSLFLAHDVSTGLLLAAMMVVAGIFVARGVALSLPASRGWHIPALAVLAFLAAIFAREVVHHGYNLSLDEVLPAFQAEILRDGHLMAAPDPALFAFREMLQPYFTYVDAGHGLWSSYYRPGHAGLIALAGDTLPNAILTAVAVLSIASVARRVFPERAEAPLLAALLLLVSPQFLMTSGSGFSFTAHLALNLAWLALFLRGGWGGHLSAALIGAVAIGLHQVHVHPLFAAPFLLALLAGSFGPRAMILPYVVICLAALPLWVLWPELAVWYETGDTSVLPRSLLEVDYIANYLNAVENFPEEDVAYGSLMLAVNLARFFTWISPALLPAALAGLLLAPWIGRVPALCGAGAVLMVLASHVLMPNQMHTWGARYYHPVLGNVVIFAMGGIYAAARRFGGTGQLRVAVLLIAASAAIALPLRAMHVSEKVGPRALVSERIAGIDADWVFIDPRGAWFAGDLVRNSPWLTNRPLIAFAMDGAVPEGVEGSYIMLDRAALTGLGLPYGTHLEPGRPE